MADINTTLHPEGAPEDNLYPNINRENIPDSALYGDLLWENASPYSQFAAQTINVGSLSGYRLLRVYFLISSSASQARQSFDIELQDGVKTLYAGFFDNTSASSYHRGLVINRNGTINVDAGRQDGTISNSACIPNKIYGIK